MLVASRFFQGAEALSFSSPPPPAPTPAGVGGLNRTVKRCAMGKATRFTQRGIDPGFTQLEGGNPLLNTGSFGSSAQPFGRLGAYLIRRRLCGSSVVELPVYSGDLLLPQSFSVVWPLPLAPGGRGASRSEGERGRPSAPKLNPPALAFPPLSLGEGLAQQGVRASPSTPNPTTRSGRSPLPLEGGGWEGVGLSRVPEPTFQRRPHHG